MSWPHQNIKSGILIRKIQLTFQEKYFYWGICICIYCTVRWEPLLMEVWKCGKGEGNVGQFLLRTRSFHLSDAIWKHEYKSFDIFEKLKAETESQSQAEQTDFRAFIAIRRNSWLVSSCRNAMALFWPRKGFLCICPGETTLLQVGSDFLCCRNYPRGFSSKGLSLSFPLQQNTLYPPPLLFLSSHGLWATVDGATKYPMKSHWDFGGRGGFAIDTLSLLIPSSVSFLPV